MAGALALALVGSAIAAWATDSWPWSQDTYCWGAWREGSGPGFLGSDPLGDGKAERSSKETAPTKDRPRGICTVMIGRTDGTATTSPRQTVVVRYLPAARHGNTAIPSFQGSFGGDVHPLPDGLPGVIDDHGGLLVLPEACDDDGDPIVVTLQASTTLDRSGAGEPVWADLGGAEQAAKLLVAAADQGMKAAGCKPGQPPRIRASHADVPDASASLTQDELACGIRKLRRPVPGLQSKLGAATRDLQTCSVWSDRADLRRLDLAMIADPRLSALFDVADRLPAVRGWRGRGTLTAGTSIIRARCAGRSLTFLMTASDDPAYLAAFANAIAARLDCAPIAAHLGAGRAGARPGPVPGKARR